ALVFFEKEFIISTITLTIGVLLFFLFKFSNLVLRIDRHIIKYKFPPFFRNFKTINIDNYVRLEVLSYDPILMFGGWGIRTNKKAKCYSTSGMFALKIKRPNSKDIYIGTNKPEDLKKIIEQIM